MATNYTLLIDLLTNEPEKAEKLIIDNTSPYIFGFTGGDEWADKHDSNRVELRNLMLSNVIEIADKVMLYYCPGVIGFKNFPCTKVCDNCWKTELGG